MSSEKRVNIPLVVAAALSALLVVGVLTFAGPCVHEDGSPATCAAASHAILAAGAVALIVSAAGAVARNARVRGALSLVAAAAGVVAAASPGWLFDLCMFQTMRCWTAMKPFALVVGVLVAVLCVVAAVGAFRSQERRKS